MSIIQEKKPANSIPTSLTVREATKADVAAAAQIFHDSFNSFNASVGLPPEWPNVEFCQQAVGGFVQHPGYYAIVAEEDHVVVGSNFLEMHDDATAPGPISVSNQAQNSGIGRILMQDVITLSERMGKKSIRLVQVANNAKSFGLYATLGFETKELLTAIVGISSEREDYGFTIRPMQNDDVEPCASLYEATNHISRKNDIAFSLHPASPFSPVVAVDAQGTIAAYSTGFFLLGHTVATSEAALKALINSVSGQQAPQPLLMHLPTRLYPQIAMWALDHGLKVLRQEILMVKGKYHDPSLHIYLPGMAY